MTGSWDVIVVGSRCAGATLATLLARSGVRTLVLEASPRGTDMPMSTHFIQTPGVDVLDRLGLGERIRAVTPATRTFRLGLDEAEAVVSMGDGRAGYCVRRSTIDPWLQEMAETSGADVRYRHRVVDVTREGERITGVVAEGPSGKETFSAPLVVGADGPHSTIAKHTQPEEYLVTEATRGGYFFYFEAPKEWTAPWDMTLEHRGGDLRYVFRCDGDLVLLVAVAPLAEAESWGSKWRERTMDMLRRSPVTAPLCEGKEPVGKGCGLLKAKYFYRRAVGPGFALIGDAGHFKDFVTGQGMTDAFLDAERLSCAVLDGREVAFERFWRERDVATLPLHFDAVRQGEVGYNNAFMRWVIERLGGRPDLLARAAMVAERRIRPDEMLPMKQMLAWMGSALVHGRFDVLKGFVAMGKSLGGEKEEFARRTALLAAVEGRIGTAGAARVDAVLASAA